MMQVPIPTDERQRLEALERYEILDTPKEESFERITRLTASLFSTPIALISIVASERVWFKSEVGSPLPETTRQESFSAWTILSHDVLVVNDALTDDRFRDSEILTQSLDFRFYAGAPLITPDGYAIGALSVIDVVPRADFKGEASRHLADLAALIVDQLELRRRTLQLQSSEADYRDLFDNCPIGIYRTSPGGEILMANPAVISMLEYPSIEMLKEKNLESDNLVGTRRDWTNRLEAEGKIRGHESVWYSYSGQPIQVRETTRAVRKASGAISYYEGWAEDISLTKAIEGERERARQFNQKLIEAVPDLIYIFDLEKDRTVFVNRSYFEVVGQDPDYVRQLKSPIDELVHPEDVGALRHHRKLFKNATDGEFKELEFRTRDADGKFRLLSCRETVFSRDANGVAREILGVMRDISSGRDMEERLRWDEDRWQLVLAANNDGLWDWDARTGKIFHSPRWLEILGFAEGDSELEGWEHLLHPDDAARIQENLARYLRREVPAYQEEYRLRAKNGAYRWVFARGVAQWADDGTLVRMVGAHSDITERKESELALRLQALELADARDKAESAAQAKATFLATMSHEIRTPLNGVIGMTGILSDTKLTDEQQDYLRTIRSSGSALLTVINDILDFSKIEAGHMELEETDFDLSVVVQESLELVAEHADRKGVELAASLEAAVPTRVRGDSGRLRQVLLNLLSNAVKFTHRGEVVLTVSMERHSAPRAMLRFAVSDTGIGMSQEVCTRVFSPFSQADASTTRRFGGTGLGLAISKQLVELMGGEIGVESKEGVGSTFWCTINLQATPEPSVMVSDTGLAGKRILVADDNATNLRIVRHLLQTAGADVICAEDGLEAMRLLLESEKSGKHIHMALLDFQMPDMDGLMLTRAIRAQRNFKDFPIVLLTSVTQRDHIQEARDLNIQGYLVKPIRNMQLLETVRNLLFTQPLKTELPTVKLSPSASESVVGVGRLLLAEDNPVNQKVGVLMLTKLGYLVDVVGNGREAVEAFQRFPYRAILLDCQMPEMDGFEATRRIREIEGGRSRIGIIALTANALAGERERCLAAGMDDYLSKPIHQKSLGEKLAAIVQPMGVVQ